MNIFILSVDPDECAQMQCDQHVVKMPLETAQMLCSVFPPGSAPYKRTHYNHPCTVWARDSFDNYSWLILHGMALCDEYEYRFGKIHKSLDVIYWCFLNCYQLKFSKKDLTPFVLAMDKDYILSDAVLSYRNYYNLEKSAFARWNKRRPPPKWYNTR